MPWGVTGPCAGARPTTMFFLVGGRREPPVSSAIAHVTRLAPTDEPDPLLDVPAERSVSYGLQLTPPNGLREMPVPTFAFARMMAPASRIRLMNVASRGGRSLAYATSAPAVVRMSNVSYQSLTANTTPRSRPTR